MRFLCKSIMLWGLAVRKEESLPKTSMAYLDLNELLSVF